MVFAFQGVDIIWELEMRELLLIHFHVSNQKCWFITIEVLQTLTKSVLNSLGIHPPLSFDVTNYSWDIS